MVKSFLVFALVIFAPAAKAYIANRGNVHVIAGPFISQTPVNRDQTSTLPDQGGFGLIILGDVNDRGSLQINTLFFNKLYYRSEGNQILSEKTSLAHVSLGYRHWWASFVSTSLLLYTSYPMGEITVVQKKDVTDPNFTTTARENAETGLDAGLGLEVFRSGRYALMIEGVYSYSLTKKPDESAEHYGVMVGVRYFIQGNEKNPIF